MSEQTCPRCFSTVEVNYIDCGECQLCGNEYFFFEECSEDFAECWMEIEWEFYA